MGRHIAPTFALPNVPVHEYVLKCMQIYGDKVALVDNTSKVKLTFTEACNRTKLLATALYRRGVRKGDIVGMIAETSCQYGVIAMAIMACGGITNPCNPIFTQDELKHQFSHSQAKYLFCSKNAMKNVNKIKASLPDLKEVFCIEPYDGVVCLEQLLIEGNLMEYPIDVSIDPDEDICTLPYSSGTTGLPKGVLLPHKAIIATIITFRTSSLIARTDRIYGVLPSFHIYGYAIQLFSLAHGCTLVTESRFEFQTMLQAIQEYKITMLMLVPPLMVLLAKSDVGKYDLSSVIKIFCGAAPLAPGTD